MAGIADKILLLIKDTVEAEDVTLWDVRFVKEGASYYLRVFIDKEEGINIDDCTAVSHAIDPVIDEADPIDKSYYLEVCSPGLERELTRPEHFEWAKDKEIRVKLYKAINGQKEIIGTLLWYHGGLRINTDNAELYLDKKEFSTVKLNDLDF